MFCSEILYTFLNPFKILYISIIRNDGTKLGSLLKALGELLTYHGMVLESKIDDSFLVMDEEAGKLVNDFSELGGKVRNGVQEYEHNQ